MLTMVIRTQIQKGKEAAFEAAAAEQVAKVQRTEPGTILYTLLRNPNQPGEYLWIEAYQDEAALAAHRDESIKSWRPIYEPMLAGPSEPLRFGTADVVAGMSREARWAAIEEL